MFKIKEIKLLRPFYANTLVISLTKVILPFYVLYFLSIGMSLAQVALITSLRSVVGFIFELPTGVIADKYGRKISVMIGYFGKVLCLAILPFTRDPRIIALAFGLDAFFQTFFSGADRALVVDYIKEKDQSLLNGFFLKERMIRNIGMVLAPILGGWIVYYFNMSSLRMVVAGGVFVATLFLFKIKESKIHKEIDNEEDESEFNFLTAKKLFSHAKNTFGYIWKNSSILLLLAGVFLYRFVDEIGGLAWTPYIKSIGISNVNIGYIFSFIAIISLMIPFVVGKILKFHKKEKILAWSIVGLSILFILIGIISIPLVIIAVFVLGNLIEEVYLPLEEALMHEHVPSKIRATTFSIKSMIESLASIIGGPIAGVLLGIISLQQGIALSGILLLFLAGIYFYFIKKRGSKLPLIN
ncbi:MAG: MFS transporter [Candidatus Absconditabacterales bacterium]